MMTGKVEIMKTIFRGQKKDRQIRALLAGTCALMATANPALAQKFDVTCTSPADTRQILVLTPGQQGKACDVLYTKNRGRTSSTPYFANSDSAYCLKKASELQAKLLQSNYSCTGIGASQATATRKVTASTAPSVQEQSLNKVSASDTRPSQKVAQADVEQIGADAEPVKNQSQRDQFLRDLKQQTPAAQTPVHASTDATSQAIRDQALAQYRQQQRLGSKVSAVEVNGPIVEQQAPAVQVPAVNEITRADNSTPTRADAPVSGPGPLPQSQTADLVALQSGIANSGPITLTNPPRQEIVTRADRLTVPSANVANKLVGATPVLVASRGVNEVRPVSSGPVPQETLVPSPASPVLAASNSFKRVASALSPTSANRPRSRPEIIRATLMAQAAAWNEGDIEAFMEGYWRSNDLTFVSGTQVTRGWTPTLKRYKERYGNGAALGQLGFDIDNVEMLANDIAIVVGRFNLNRNNALDSGTFTLVMKQFEGAWRIVHDHTVADAPAPTAPDAE